MAKLPEINGSITLSMAPARLIRAAAVERCGRVHVLSTAGGRARRFDFPVATWAVLGAARAVAIAARVEREIRLRGVRFESCSVRVSR